MEVRITYRSEIYIEGDTLEDVRKTFDSISLDPIGGEEHNVTDYGFIEVTSVEDASTYNDLKNEFENL